MFLDTKTLLFIGLNYKQRAEMVELAEAIVVKGALPEPLPSFAEEWLTAAGVLPHNRLLLISTALPQRLLISVIRSLDGVTLAEKS